MRLVVTALATCLAVSPAIAAPKVIASVVPVHGIVSAVMGETGQPELLLSGSMSEHRATFTPQQIADMGKAAESHGCVHEEDYRAEEMFHLVGQSGYGLVDQISERTGRPTGRQVSGYKTLIIVGPTTRWDSGQPQPLNATLKWEDPAAAGSPDTTDDGDYSSSSAGATQAAPTGKSDDF